MKTLQSYFNLLLFFPAAVFFFAGCYTHMDTVRDDGAGGRDGDDYAYTDSTNASNDTAGANYFSDDDYRESRYRMSFDYYCPPAYIWGSNICYDPWYDYYTYPWYPYPYWYGYSPYWGHGYGYWSYYGGGYGYRGGHGRDFFAGRTRTIGSTRGGDAYQRSRNGFGVSGTVPSAGGVASSRTRTPSVPEAAATATSRTRSRQEVPWWERAKSSTDASSDRNRLASRSQSVGRRGSVDYQRRNAVNPQRSGSQAYPHRGRMQPAQAGSGGPQPRQAARQASPRSSSPQGSSGRSGSSGGGSRSGGGGGRGSRSR